jgi:hypothetical protein
MARAPIVLTDFERNKLSDRLNTHQSESLARLVAEQEELNEELGVKGKKGILKNMKSRAVILQLQN